MLKPKNERPKVDEKDYKGKWRNQGLTTLLLTRDQLDGIPDFLNQPQYHFDKCSVAELQFAYQILVLSLKPIYSGSLDHRVNTVDIKKMKEILKTQVAYNINKYDVKLMQDFVQVEQDLYSAKMKHAIWNRDYQECVGSEPDAVEGA